MTSKIRLSILLAFVLLSVPTVRAAVVLDPGRDSFVEARVAIGGSVTNQTQDLSLDGSGSVVAGSRESGNFADANWRAAAAADDATFWFGNIELERGSDPSSIVVQAYCYVNFIIDTDTPYSVTGLMDTNGPGTSSAQWRLQRTSPADVMLYREREWAGADTEDTQFLPNLTADGGILTHLTGDFQGLLTPGSYYFGFQYYLQATSQSDHASTSAKSFARLDLGDGVELDSVPEPTSLVLWSTLGAMGLIAARRRRRTA